MKEADTVFPNGEVCPEELTTVQTPEAFGNIFTELASALLGVELWFGICMKPFPANPLMTVLREVRRFETTMLFVHLIRKTS
jgi:hypothetical protein